MLQILFKNLFGYDAFIFIAAAINIVLFRRILKYLNAIETDFQDTKYLQNEWLIKHLADQTHRSAADLKDVLNRFTKNKQKLDQTGVFYISLTSIFPLLGILGTVVSLLTLTDFSSIVASVSFSKALTSTFWGILFGVISKFGEGFFTAKLELYDKLYHEVRTIIISSEQADE